MYISRIPLNMARYGAKELISSPYKLHSAVEHAFVPTETSTQTDGRILWRIDITKQGKEVWLYVVSPYKPDFTHIVEQAGWPLHNEWESKNYDTLLNSITQGQRWRFRLRANPVHKVPAKTQSGKPDALAGTIQGHVTVAKQEQWLLERAEGKGFRILTDQGIAQLAVTQRQKQQFARKNKTVTLNTAQFDGILEVTDAELFRQTLCNGLGRAKGFGCGLLTIAPIMSKEKGQNDGQQGS